MSDAYIYDHCRTPRGKGKKDGSLHQASPVWLLRTLLTALRDRHALDTSLVDDVVLGCVTPVGEQGADIARTAVLDAPADCALMKREIFGPILPLVGYKRVDEAVSAINAGDRPLAI